MARITKRSLSNRRGFTLLDNLVASAVVGLSLIGLVSTLGFCYNITRKNNSVSASYAVGRNAVERMHSQGFQNAAEGTTTTYYALDTTGPFTTLGTNRYKVVTAITADTHYSGTAIPADYSLRTVTVKVTDLSTNTLTYSTGTILVRAGI